jgi:hypothetical protein
MAGSTPQGKVVFQQLLKVEFLPFTPRKPVMRPAVRDDQIALELFH